MSSLTGAAFSNLLTHLGPDPDGAGSAYEELRRALVSFFGWRGAAAPDECADETLDRLAARLHDGLAVADLRRFARGIARRVLLERWRRLEARGVPLTETISDRQATGGSGAGEDLPDCLQQCLRRLPPDARAFILEYYAGDGRERIETRKRMARTLGVSESALRNRAQRLRDQLERCITSCRRSA